MVEYAAGNDPGRFFPYNELVIGGLSSIIPYNENVIGGLSSIIPYNENVVGGLSSIIPYNELVIGGPGIDYRTPPHPSLSPM